MLFEFLIPKRPVSCQTKRRHNLQAWKDYVRTEASQTWSGKPYNSKNLHLMLVYLCDTDPVDADNIIKPIQDALIGLVYDDDILISDVESHRRPLTGSFEIRNYPDLLINGILSGAECVYVRITESMPLENYFS